MQQPTLTIVEILTGLLGAANVVIDRREAVGAGLAAFREGKPDFTDHLIGHVNRMAGCETSISIDKDTKRSSPARRLAARDG